VPPATPRTPKGAGPIAALDLLPESQNATPYWVVYAGDGDTFSLDALDWWDDASMHRELNGVEVADDE